MRFRKEKPRASGDIPDASLPDIAFLLLIFFLVTTTFEVQRGIAYRLPRKPDEQIEEVVIEETNRLVLTVKQWGLHEYVALVDQAPPGGPLERARAGEDISLADTTFQRKIWILASDRAESLSVTTGRLLENLESAKGVPGGTYRNLSVAIQTENLVPQVRAGIQRQAMGDAAPSRADPIFGEVAFGDTLVLVDARQGEIATVVVESELVVILKFFPDCDYEGMVAALDMLRRNGVSRTGITIQERTGGGDAA
ncbi:biopolymer transporter ExbD [Candidatus Fermentibacterales bacterium]|nr:biopolymer transporter ExbD [Candidatus Fermentibacterales bacterium]